MSGRRRPAGESFAGPTTAALAGRLAAKLGQPPRADLNAGRATFAVQAPQSRNKSGGHWAKRHGRKQRLDAEIALMLIAAGVPRPIPGDRVRATAVVRFAKQRYRDEGNYRDSLEKSLGDALDPHEPNAPWRWLTNDTPDHFTFPSCTFAVVPGTIAGGVAEITLEWGPALCDGSSSCDAPEHIGGCFAGPGEVA